MTTALPAHILVATGTSGCDECPPGGVCLDCREYADLDFSIECPGVTDRCRRWDECMACTRRARQDYSFAELLHEVPQHGVQHRWIPAIGFCTPTDGCYVAQADELPDAAVELVSAPGRYPVDHDFDDGLVLFLLPSTDATPASAQ